MKIKLLPIFCLLSTTLSFAQELSISASSGYNFGFAQGNLDVFKHNKLVAAFSNVDEEQHKYSMSEGLNFDFNLGYRFKKSVGVYFGLSYLLGLTQTARYTDRYDENRKFRIEASSKLLRLSSGIFVNSTFGKFILRPELGLNFGWGQLTYVQSQVDYNYLSYQYTNRFSGGFNFGIKAELKVLYPLNSTIQLWLAANCLSSFYSPTTFRCTSASGDDYGIPMETYEREGKFVDNPHNSNDPNQPYEFSKRNFAASSLGLQLGVQFRLWKKVEKKEE